MNLRIVSRVFGLLRLTGISSVTCQDSLDGLNSPTPMRKCIPGQACWPSESTWAAFNDSIDGQLIKTTPLAESCYQGDAFDPAECARVFQAWTVDDFQTSDPAGRPLPYNITCPPVDYEAGDEPVTDCTLGQLPVFAVNATSRDHISAALSFAQTHNIRLTVASTGHDLYGRADGFGSMQIWLRHYREGITFEESYAPHDGQCDESNWTGSAVHINGAYQWRDVNQVAEEHNVIVVGGGSVSPGAIGGWFLGGGHGPASRNYGLGAEQALEAEVMLADGRVVLANHCQHADLFRALRGGGPGYGIVLGLTVKAYPNVNVVTAHHLTIIPRTGGADNSALLDAISVLMQSYPDLNDAGFAGDAAWSRSFPYPFIGNATSGYTHTLYTIGKGQDEAETAYQPVREALELFQDELLIQESYATYKDYWSFYGAESGRSDPVGDTSFITSRMIDRSAATSSAARTRRAVELLGGAPEEFTINIVLLVSDGRAHDDTAGLHPSWRDASFLVLSARGIPRGAPPEVRAAVENDITFVKGAAAKEWAPGSGGYMNEGDRRDPEYKDTFYGSNYESHLAAKTRYDPLGVFYCPTCVGSEAFFEDSEGALCREG